MATCLEKQTMWYEVAVIVMVPGGGGGGGGRGGGGDKIYVT